MLQAKVFLTQHSQRRLRPELARICKKFSLSITGLQCHRKEETEDEEVVAYLPEHANPEIVALYT